MSQSDSEVVTLIGNLDTYYLTEFDYGTYYFELSNLPVSNSISIEFEGNNSITRSEIDIVVVTDADDYVEDNINYINYNSSKTDLYAKALIGGSFVDDDGKNVNITKDNYLLYKNKLVDRIFVDFSGSEKIKSILDEIDDISQRVCGHFTLSYFSVLL